MRSKQRKGMDTDEVKDTGKLTVTDKGMDTETTLKIAIVRPGPQLPGPSPKQQPVQATPHQQFISPASRSIRKLDIDQARLVQEQCRQICLSVFFREHAPVRSLGFTSPIGGEGKSFLSLMTAKVLANDSPNPVTLIDCNWYHPSLHEAFRCPLRPGLAEWLRGECHEMHIRYQVGRNLTFIPAGSGKQDAVTLLHQIRKKGLLNMLAHSNDLLIVDLPSIVNTACGPLAASLTESLIIVVRAGVTPDALIAEACTQLKDARIHGLVLNQMESHIPRWLQQLL